MTKVLLIEDDLNMRENTAEILSLTNFDVTTATNGKEGCTKAKESAPDIIISDIMMPGLDGYGVLHVLSKDPTTAKIPFIFLTGKTEKTDIRKGMNLGANDYLTKPFKETELLAAIDSRLKKNEQYKLSDDNESLATKGFTDKTFGKEKLEMLSNKQSSVRYKKKQTIFQQGDIPNFLYYLKAGKVKVFKIHEDGKEYLTDIFKTGDFFGVCTLFEGSNYKSSAVTLEDSEICKIPKEDFLDLMYQNQEIAEQFIKILSNDVVEKEKKLLSFAYDSVRTRVAAILVQLNHKYHTDDNPYTSIKIARNDLAAMAGVATESIIRCLSDFKADQLIEVHGREIIIKDVETLKEVHY